MKFQGKALVEGKRWDFQSGNLPGKISRGSFSRGAFSAGGVIF